MKISGLRVLFLFIILALIPYHQLYWYPFINIDDTAYVTQNIMVQKGLGWESLQWAFSTLAYGNWAPLTWLSHTIDCSLFGLNTAGHHMMNVALHILASWLFFLAWQRLTGDRLISLLAALVYLLHPQHVEAVAWVASRKDVLSGLFWNLSLLFYAVYAEKPSVRSYLPVFFAMLFGLMSKSVLVALPLVLLVLDIWPLKRIRDLQLSGVWQLLFEKIPLFALSGIFVLLTMFAQSKLGATDIFESRSFYYSLLEPAVNYWLYVREFLVPVWLILPYPMPDIEVLQGLAGLFGLLGLTVFSWLIKGRLPWLLTGWLYFLLSLVSYAGFVRVGVQSMADRWMYVPLGGLAIMAVGSVVEIWRLTAAKRHALGVMTAFVAALLVLCFFQVRTWSSPEVLIERAARVSARNFMAHIWLASHYRRQRQSEKALAHFEEVQRIYPRASNFANIAEMFESQGRSEEILDYFKLPDTQDTVFYNSEASRYFYSLALIPKARRLYIERFGADPAERSLVHAQEFQRLAPGNVRAWQMVGLALMALNRSDEARSYFEKSIEINPFDPAVLHNLGMTYFRDGDLDTALDYLQRSLEMGPGSLEPFIDLAQVLIKSGKLKEAEESLRRAVQLIPDSYKTNNYLGTVLLMQKRYDDALAVFKRAVEINKEGSAAYAGIGAALFQKRQYLDAYEALKTGVEINPGSAQIHSNLGAVSIQLGRLDEGKYHLEEALKLDPELTETREMLKGFR